MTRLNKYVRMARQRRLNFWQARWRTEAIEEEDLFEASPQSFESPPKRGANDVEDAMPDNDDDETH